MKDLIEKIKQDDEYMAYSLIIEIGEVVFNSHIPRKKAITIVKYLDKKDVNIKLIDIVKILNKFGYELKIHKKTKNTKSKKGGIK